MVKLVIFDLDGTLVNSVYDLADAVNNVLKRNGYPTHEYEKFYHFVGNGTLKLVERALFGCDVSEGDVLRMHDEFAKEYDVHCLDKTCAYAGISEMLSELSRMQIMTAVASNKTDVFTKKIVKTLFPKHKFFDAVGSIDGVPKKPSPEIVNNIIKNACVTASEALYVGDSNVDVLTGHNAMIPVCGCEWGFRGRKELSEAGSDYLVSSPEKIVDLIVKLNKL